MFDLKIAKMLLDLLEYPAFFVKEEVIILANRQAECLLLEPGVTMKEALGNSYSYFAAYNGGIMNMQVNFSGFIREVTITQHDDMQLFSLKAYENDERALALAAEKLSAPLQSLLIMSDSKDHPDKGEMRRYLHQIMRMVANMSDYPRYRDGYNTGLESVEMGWFFSEIVDKASALLEEAGIRLEYTALPINVYGMIEPSLVERAIYNLISNAVKFSARGSTVSVKLVSNADRIHFIVENQGTGIPTDVRMDLFMRHLRIPAVEEGRRGIGFGMPLAQLAASRHDGSVFVEEIGDRTRVTLTMRITPLVDGIVRSSIKIPTSDYAGGFDHALVELSDVLPDHLYK